ncbi:hypothetical protein KAR04_01190 [Candidatus Calescamantes bacterium]|nr:hypothetical protein [Candidatus Calescamantes bacterium]MCK5597997.1 hypothetical protein [bacterium]
MRILPEDLFEKKVLLILKRYSIDVYSYIRRHRTLLQIIFKLENISSAGDPAQLRKLSAFFLLNEILINEKKRVRTGMGLILNGYLNSIIFSFAGVNPLILTAYARYNKLLYSSLPFGKPGKKALKNFESYASWIGDSEGMRITFLFYLAGLGMDINVSDAGVLARVGKGISVFLHVENEFGDPAFHKGDLFKVGGIQEGMSANEKLSLISEDLNRYYKIIEDDIDKLSDSDLKLFFLFEITEQLSEILNIMSKEY